MHNIREVSTKEISKYINSFRKTLIRRGFFEHSLYNTTPYEVVGTPSFRLQPSLFLRYGTEPDVWGIGEHFDKFFFIGSLFRNEQKLTKIHNYEFKLLDYYIHNGSIRDAVRVFISLLRATETELHVRQLSKLKIVFSTYKSFHKNKFESDKECWVVVTQYPIEESFYDTPAGESTNKFEIMYHSPKQTIEVASAGEVGINFNKKVYIKSDYMFTNWKVFKKRFMGLGFGIERLIYLYSYNK